MRFGWLAAAAAMVMGAGQAHAATYVQYEARGTGVESSQYGSFSSVRSGDLFFRFVIELVDIAGHTNTTTFSALGDSLYGRMLFTTSLKDGTLTFTSRPPSYGTYLFDTAIAVPSSPQTFSELPASSPVTGNIFITFPNPLGGTLYSGAVTSLVRVGNVSTFIAPFATVLPEPASWAMMILGIGVVGAAMRRRRTLAFA